ncbi:MAG TPA: hypothetical protein VGG39_05500 [Polyangiaceae bacterium]
MRIGVLVAALVAATAFTGTANAEPTHFGSQGELVISDDQPIGLLTSFGTGLITPLPPGSTSTASFQFASVSGNNSSGTEFGLSPALDYFVIDSLSLGADLLVEILSPSHENPAPGTTSTNPGGQDTLLGIAPRVGYDLRLSDAFTFWPKVYFAYATLSGPGGGANSETLGVFAPFLWHPVPHFFLGLGPNFSTQLGNNLTGGGQSQGQPKVTQLGIQATLGGWFGD